MRRTTERHSPRRDDQLEREEHALLHGTPDDGRTEPRRAEGPGADEAATGVGNEAEQPQHGAPTASETENRAALPVAFPPSLFPTWRAELVDAAKDSYADAWLLAALHRIPDRLYGTVGELYALLAVSPAPGEE